MPAVGLLTDSTWSLTLPTTVEVPLAVLPLHVTCGAVSVTDTPANRDRIDDLITSGTPATTSQPSTAEIREALASLRSAGVERVLAIHISGSLSGTCDAVRAVGEAFVRETDIPVEVVDSRSFGAGTGLAVMAAAMSLAEGRGADDAASAARRVALGSESTIVVQDLRHLQRGGRLRLPRAIVGQALGVRPLLVLEDGKMVLGGTARGERRLTEALVERVLTLARAQHERGDKGVDVGVHHSVGATGVDEVAARLIDAIEVEGIPVNATYRGRISPVLSVHGGPGSFAVVTAPSC